MGGFRLETDRRGSTFYCPTDKGRMVLNQGGADADELVVRYRDRRTSLTEAFREFASDLIQAANDSIHEPRKVEPFVFEAAKAQ